MNWKKLVSLLIVSVFIVSALAAVNSPAKAQEGQYVDSITLEVRTNQQTALGEVATRDLDVFLQTVSGSTYDSISDSWKAQMNTWLSIGGYNSQYYNPAHTESPYECEVEGQMRFNPFSIKKVRMAQNFLFSRQEIVDELYNGFAEPRFLWIGIQSPGYEQYFEEIKEQYGFTAQGDYDRGKQMVQEGMEEAMNDDELLGDLREGDDGFWEYRPPGGSWSDIEITGITRIEDEREQIGEMQTEILQDCGFKVNNNKMDRQSYGAIVWSSDPADLQWQFYTGGWLASAAQFYQEVIPAQMGSGWYGYMPGGFVSTADYRYGYWSNGNFWDNTPDDPDAEFYGNLTMAELSSKLYMGQVNSLDQYWNWMQQCTEIMTGEAVRCFIVSTYDYFAYDKDTIVSAATDVLTGWSDVFTPRTMKTTDGTLTGAQYSSQGSLYMDNWNELGGSSDVYGLQQKRMLFDGGYNLDPSNGKPIPVRWNWHDSEGNAMIEKDYNWYTNETGVQKLNKNISVPTDAVVYNPGADSWEEVGENKTSAIKITYDIVLGNWHTGEAMTMADIMGWHAWSWEMSFDDGEGDNFFHSGYGGQARPYYNSIVGEVWNESAGTLTIYGDYTLPVDSKIGGYFTDMPQLHYTQYMAAQFLVNQNTEYAPSGTGTYAWDNVADHWIHWLSESQGQDFKATLQNMISDNYMPWFVTEEGNAPITVSETELNNKRQALVDFYDDHKHFYASQGPFMMDTVNAENMYVDMVRFTQEDGYPWPVDHWEDKLRIAELAVSGSNVPSLVQAPNTLEVSFDVQVDEDYPNDVTRDVTGDDDATAEIMLMKEGQVIETKTPTLIASTFQTSFETGDLTPGQYTVRFSGSIPIQTGSTSAQASVVIEAEPADVEVTDFNVPSTAAPGESVSITATVTNNGGDSTTVDVYAGGELLNSYVVGAGESVNVDESYTFDSPGTYQISIAGQTQSIQIISTNLVVSNLDVADSAIVGDSVTISVTVENTGNAELTDSIYVDGEAIEDFTLSAGEEKDLTVEHTFDSAGDHTVSVGTDSHTINIQEAIVISNPSVEKDSVKKGNKLEISATITNNDDVAHDVEVQVGGETVHTFNVQAGASQEYTYEHTFDEKGDFEVTIGGESAGTVEVKKSGDGTPGFTMVLLGISAVAAVALYYRRRK